MYVGPTLQVNDMFFSKKILFDLKLGYKPWRFSYLNVLFKHV